MTTTVTVTETFSIRLPATRRSTRLARALMASLEQDCPPGLDEAEVNWSASRWGKSVFTFRMSGTRQAVDAAVGRITARL